MVEKGPEVTVDSIPWEMVPKNAQRVIRGYLEDIPSDLTVENPDSTQKELIECLDAIIGSNPFENLSNRGLAIVCFEEAAVRKGMGQSDIAAHLNILGETLRSIARTRKRRLSQI